MLQYKTRGERERARGEPRRVAGDAAGRLPSGWTVRDIFGLEHAAAKAGLTMRRKNPRNFERRDKFYRQLATYYESIELQPREGRLNPIVRGRELDVCRLYFAVNRHGGYGLVTEERKWPAVLDALRWSAYLNETELQDVYHLCVAIWGPR